MLPEPEWGRFPYQKGRGACQKFSQEPLRGTKTLFCGRGLKFVSPLRGTNSKTVPIVISCHIFWLNTLKVTKKGPTADLLRRNTLRGFKTAFLNPYKVQWANPSPRPRRPSPKALWKGRSCIMQLSMQKKGWTIESHLNTTRRSDKSGNLLNDVTVPNTTQLL